MAMAGDYEKLVYTSLLGKVIGVYSGRPYEGWSRERIQEKWGAVTRYVHGDCGVPLVVADDDISGTLTFIRALSDSGLYEKTPDSFYGWNWLNYLIPGQTILWWGGMFHSTEHTAYIRLKQGVESPRSGSMELNGREVSEQIGAQIFIDAFGMVAPGRPELAAQLAEKAARVSHDGEAVYAAQVVAAMVSAAFVERDINKILDIGVSVIPRDSLIARLHRDVRAWAEEYPDWNDTFDRISEKYGYSKFGGNCHIIPNHAVMVMAWAYGGNDFHKTMSIVCTAGWDTDCNAANVGSVSALVCGLEHLCDTYDFLSPFGDRIYVPTADGTYAISDVLEQALMVADSGRRVMDMPLRARPKGGAMYHFEMPNARQGFLPVSGRTALVNAPAPEGFAGKRCLESSFSATPDGPCRFETRLVPECSGNYSIPYTPRLYSGNTLRVRGRLCGNNYSLRMYLTLFSGERIYSSAASGEADGFFELVWTPEFGSGVSAFGFECRSEAPADGRVQIDFIDISGVSRKVLAESDYDYSGWISNMDGSRSEPFSNDTVSGMRYWISNGEPCVFVTGNRTWGDTCISTLFQIHSADRAGILVHYQGLCRWTGAIFSRDSVKIIRNHYGEEVLAETGFTWCENQPMQLMLRTSGTLIELAVDGKVILTADDDLLKSGGAGIFIRTGMCGFSSFAAEANIID